MPSRRSAKSHAAALSPPAASSPTSMHADNPCDHPPLQILARIARQSGLGDPEGCAAILSLLATARAVRDHLHGVLARLDLTEMKLFTLVVLYASDPDPSTPAELAAQSRVSRAAMSDTLETLRLQGWIVRNRSEADRRVQCVELTDRGRTLVERTVEPFLQAINRCASGLSRDEHRTLRRSCAQLCAALPAAS